MLLPGSRIGHYTDLTRGTGCTVILCEDGATAGVDVRGAAPGTRETDLLHPSNLVDQVHAVVLGGGSAFGLAAADGVMQYLFEHHVGLDTGVARVPIVPAAILFDLSVGPVAWPDAAAGYQACQAATTDVPTEGSVGAGTGAAVGRWRGMAHAVKGGIGYHSLTLPDGVTVAALVAVNAFGNIVDPGSGEVLAGARDGSTRFADPSELLSAARPAPFTASNTTIGVVMTDAALTKAQAHGLARAAHDGIAWSVRPAHTLFDGDTLFTLSLGTRVANPVALGTAAAIAVSQAILRGVRRADGLHNLPSVADLRL